MSRKSNDRIIAAIDIGSSSIRMQIAEQKTGGELEILDELRQQVRLGKDTFKKGRISRSTIDECTNILNRFTNLCVEYGVTKIRAVATTAVREAVNVDVFIDNIRINTKIDIEILSPLRETEYIYRVISGHKEKLDPGSYQGIIEVGSGSVEIVLFNSESIVFSTTLPVGVLKMKQIFNKGYMIEDNFANYLKVQVEHELRNINLSHIMNKIDRVYAVGTEIEHITASVNGYEETAKQLSKERLKKLCEKIKNYTEEEMIHKMHVSYDLSETFYGVSLILLKVADFLDCNTIHIPQVSLLDCIMMDMVKKFRTKEYIKKIERQISYSAIRIGRSLNFDEKHARNVLDLSISLYDQTRRIHKLPYNYRKYLVGAALLHDIGTAISIRSHHKHSLYIINAQDFFYQTEREKNIIANIARYHRKSAPKSTHPDYMALSHRDRMLVTKLSAILRIADSLDNSHRQLVEDIKVIYPRGKGTSFREGKIYLETWVKDNIYAEAYAFKGKRQLFEEFFGVSVRLNVKKIVKG